MANELTSGLLIALALLSSGCGSAHSSSRRAEVIPSTRTGVTCFIIIGDDEKPVGGSCLKD